MSLSVGDKLGPYEIVEAIGKGGMGEVYRAQDTRLGRDVAIKVSSERFSERFEREARAVASLNHPNVCTLHDVGPDYLVMELVEGSTLAERIKEGPLPLDEALPIARQIADALEAAHEKGITHRDLKPGNVTIKPDGSVKVLDFGLAKITPSSSSSVERNPEESPTLSMAATQAGIIMGTAPYMAPEQARGKNVDKRADIWAFGVVLYEMVTGKRLFRGEDVTDTLAAVVRDKPDLSDAPAQLRPLLASCLEKDPKNRLRDIGDVWRLLETPARAHTQAVDGRKTWLWPTVAAAVFALVAAALGVIHFREVQPEGQSVQFLMDPPAEGRFVNTYGGYAPSPDGRFVVFNANNSGGSSLWLRSLDSLTARPLPGTEGGNFPTWSPDSRSVAFFASGSLKRIEIEGGAALTLGNATNDPVSPTGTWNEDGVILYGSAAGLQRVSASGGGATLLTKVNPELKETGHGYPQFLPDGNRFLYFAASGDPGVQGVYASSLDQPEQREQVLRTAAKAVYVPPVGAHPGYLLWMQEQTLVAQRFDPATLQREGDPVSVAEDIGLNPNNPIRAAFWASDSGLLIYFATPPDVKRQIVWMSRDGKALGGAIPEDNLRMPALSGNADRLAVTRTVGSGRGQANEDIWVWEFLRETMTRLTFDAARDDSPVWSPDGRQVAFSSDREGVWQIYRKDASGAGQDDRLTEGPGDKQPLDWGKDYLVYIQGNAGTNGDLYALPLAGDRKPITLVQTPFRDNVGRISPDGLWLAYKNDESGRAEIYIQAFPVPGENGRPGGKWQISNDGASDMSWRNDGGELYYEALDGRVMAVEVKTGPQGVTAGTPRELFSADIDTGALHSFQATGDGQRFLLFLNPQNPADQRLTVVSGWQATLRQ